MPIGGGSALFVPAFFDFCVYWEVLRVWIQDLRPCGEVLPFLYWLFGFCRLSGGSASFFH
jgi:hypothetical protein